MHCNGGAGVRDAGITAALLGAGIEVYSVAAVYFCHLSSLVEMILLYTRCLSS